MRFTYIDAAGFCMRVFFIAGILYLNSCQSGEDRTKVALSSPPHNDYVEPDDSLINNDTGWARDLKISASGKEIGIARNDGTIELIEVSSLKTLVSIPNSDLGQANGVDLSPDGVRIIGGFSKFTAEGNKSAFTATIREWRRSSASVMNEWHSTVGGARAIRYSRDGRMIFAVLSSASDAHLYIQDIMNGRELQETLTMYDSRGDLALSPDGSVLSTSSNLFSLRDLPILRSKQIDVRAFSTDGKYAYGPSIIRIASTESSEVAQGRIRIYDSSTWELMCSFDSGDSVMYCGFSVSPDRKYLLACMSDHINVWGLEKGQEVARLVAYSSGRRAIGLERAYFFPDSSHVIGTTQFGIRMWKLPLPTER